MVRTFLYTLEEKVERAVSLAKEVSTPTFLLKLFATCKLPMIIHIAGIQMLRYAKRNGFLDFETDWFFNFQKMDDRFHAGLIFFILTQQFRLFFNRSAGAKALHAMIKAEKHPLLDFIVVYGELFGGFYPSQWDVEVSQRVGESVCKVPLDIRAVQEGVYYSQDLDYMVFDVGCVMMNGEFVFLSFEEMQAYVKKTKFLVSEALAIVDHFPTDYNLNFKSYLARQINEHVFETNIAEGIVVRPLEEIVLQSSSANQAPTRCIIKMKNAKFSEELEDLKDGCSDTSSISQLKSSYQFCFAKLINTNRLQAVLSKDVGVVTVENKGSVSQALADDAWETFYEKFATTVQIRSWDDARTHVLRECERLVQMHLS
jgi:Rnl2 family RNA ligase